MEINIETEIDNQLVISDNIEIELEYIDKYLLNDLQDFNEELIGVDLEFESIINDVAQIDVEVGYMLNGDGHFFGNHCFFCFFFLIWLDSIFVVSKLISKSSWQELKIYICV